jgi:hypothetical protein
LLLNAKSPINLTPQDVLETSMLNRAAFACEDPRPKGAPAT